MGRITTFGKRVLLSSGIGRRILVSFLVPSIVLLVFFGVFISFSSSTVIENRANERLLSETSQRTAFVEKLLDQYLNDMKILSHYEEIRGLYAYRYNSTAIDSYMASLSSEDKINGSHYPVLLDGVEIYETVLGYFLDIIEDRPEIDLIRVFYRDGNVLCGVADDGPDMVDYKGDKSWFDDVVNKKLVDEGEYYVSPLSIARRTNTSSIRYMTPFDIGTERVGLLIINFESSVITGPIEKTVLGETGFGMLVDTNYENAEGDRMGAIFLANGLQPELAFDESTAGSIAFSASSFEGDNGTIAFTMDGISWRGAYNRLAVEGRDFVVIIAWSVGEIQAPVYSLVLQVAVLILIVAAVITGISMYISYRTSSQLTDLANTAQQIAAGDLTVEIEDDKAGKDEIGELTRAFGGMVSSLRELIRRIQAAGEKLLLSSEQMASSTEEVNASSEEISSVIQQMNRGAQTQAEQINKAVSNVDELSEVVEKTVNDIDATLGLIMDVANQTNMLALNAAIEAARAGDYGRGFAVVADNVRRLAEDTKNNSSNIQELIEGIQRQISSSVDRIAKAVDSVAAVAEETAASSEEASAATEEQTATMEEMSAASQGLAQLAQDLMDSVAMFKIQASMELGIGKESSKQKQYSEKVVKRVKHE